MKLVFFGRFESHRYVGGFSSETSPKKVLLLVGVRAGLRLHRGLASSQSYITNEYVRKILSEQNTVGIVPQDSWPWCESLFIADFKFQDHWTFEITLRIQALDPLYRTWLLLPKKFYC